MSLQTASNSVFDSQQSQMEIWTMPKFINLALTLQNILYRITNAKKVTT
jgi:hypothetical protein